MAMRESDKSPGICSECGGVASLVMLEDRPHYVNGMYWGDAPFEVPLCERCRVEYYADAETIPIAEAETVREVVR